MLYFIMGIVFGAVLLPPVVYALFSIDLWERRPLSSWREWRTRRRDRVTNCWRCGLRWDPGTDSHDCEATGRAALKEGDNRSAADAIEAERAVHQATRERLKSAERMLADVSCGLARVAGNRGLLQARNACEDAHDLLVLIQEGHFARYPTKPEEKADG